MIALSSSALPAAGPDEVIELFRLYDSGAYEEFASRLRREDFGDAFDDFANGADAWLTASPERAERRRIVAACVALEVAHTLRDRPADRAGAFLVWASQRMRDRASRSDVDRLWYLASVASMQELDEPWVLSAGRATGNSRMVHQHAAMGTGGQLAIAKARFPDERRFALGQVQATESAVVRIDSAPAFLEFVDVLASTRVFEVVPNREAQDAVAVRNQAADILRARRRIPDVIAAYLALQIHPDLRGEAALHIGYLESLQSHWSVALDHLHRVPSLTDDPLLHYLSFLLVGRVQQSVGDSAASIAAFEEADRIVPGARSALTFLAAQLMSVGTVRDWDRAQELLRRTHSQDAPDDPWRLYDHGDARLWPVHMARLREALR